MQTKPSVNSKSNLDAGILAHEEKTPQKGLNVAVMANPHSGKKRFLRGNYEQKFRAVINQINQAENNPNQADLYITQNLNEIIQVGKELKQKKIDIIAIFGGDGAIQKTITRLVTVYQGDDLPPVLLLRGGTMNNVARSFRAKGKPVKRLAQFLAEARKDNLVLHPRRTMDINGEIGFMYGVGLPASFIKIYDEGGHAGPLKAIQMIFLLLSSFFWRGKRIKEMFAKLYGKVTIKGADKTLDGESITGILAQTIPNLALGFHITYRALERLDRCHAIITNASALSIMSRALHILFRLPFQNKKIINDLVEEIHFYPAQNFFYMIDGDIFQHPDPSKPLSMTMGPVIRFVWFTQK